MLFIFQIWHDEIWEDDVKFDFNPNELFSSETSNLIGSSISRTVLKNEQDENYEKSLAKDQEKVFNYILIIRRKQLNKLFYGPDRPCFLSNRKN